MSQKLVLTDNLPEIDVDFASSPQKLVLIDANPEIAIAEGTQDALTLRLATIFKGDPGPPGSGAIAMSGIAGEDLARGTPLCVDRVTGRLRAAHADSYVASFVIGLAGADTAHGFALDAVQGPFALPGLSPGLPYFLGVAGGLTTVPPVVPGQSVVEVGLAASRNELSVAPKLPILL